MLDNINRLLTHDIWICRTSAMPKPKAAAIRLLRVAALSVRLFMKNKCQLRASALTFFTLLSIVPVVALLFGIAKGYGFEMVLQSKLRDSLAGHEEVADRIIAFSSTMLDNAKGGMIAGVGVLVLLWTVIRLLSNIEGALNEIWGVQQGRPILRKVSDYLSIVLICPFLIIASGSATVLVASQITGISNALPFSETLNTLIGLGLKVLPVIATWAVFCFLYAFMPNTKVRFGSALVAGIVAGTLYHGLQEAYVFTQIGVARYNAIYGSFAALPLFLIWLQISWMIALFGAEVSFAIQNVHAYELDPGDKGVSLARKKLHTLELARQAAVAFEGGRQPMSDEELSKLLEIPVRTTRQILFDLVSAGILSEANRPDGSRAYQPAIPTERLTPTRVLAAVESLGEESSSARSGKMPQTLEALNKAMESSLANRPLSKI